jgi:hypothetical protein
MSYVPIIVPTNAPPPSPRTRELANLLGQVLDEYTKANPATTSAEIRAAYRMARAASGKGSANVAAGVSVALGLGVAMLTLGLFFFRGAGEIEIGPIFPGIIMAVIVLVGLVAIVVNRR